MPHKCHLMENGRNCPTPLGQLKMFPSVSWEFPYKMKISQRSWVAVLIYFLKPRAVTFHFIFNATDNALQHLMFALFAKPRTIANSFLRETKTVCMVPYKWAIISITVYHPPVFTFTTEAIGICLGCCKTGGKILRKSSCLIYWLKQSTKYERSKIPFFLDLNCFFAAAHFAPSIRFLCTSSTCSSHICTWSVGNNVLFARSVMFGFTFSTRNSASPRIFEAGLAIIPSLP